MRVERLQQLQVNAVLVDGDKLLDAEDEEDMRTPLFQNASHKWSSMNYDVSKNDGHRGGIVVRASQWAKKKSKIVAYHDPTSTAAKKEQQKRIVEDKAKKAAIAISNCNAVETTRG